MALRELMGRLYANPTRSPIQQYSADLEKSSRKVPAEDEFVALYPDGEATDYRDQETDSETDVEDNPVHEECRNSNSNTNVCIIHPINF
ncbi:hypothetical protein AVEN_91856-1 [Araneus ventricosus]|uniref:Uncharacterized protein n=1 Tax=Araneus ventricosus TaxID=182803 RepID=A0A4Y2U2W3_ARAVE|nr:hypothetical protein AVEN_33382-1 [Araneus ventricosus]GBO06848.1 hypothetical protein AVEN_91856-1 [Araneus ventricosus]